MIQKNTLAIIQIKYQPPRLEGLIGTWLLQGCNILIDLWIKQKIIKPDKIRWATLW